VSLTEAEIQDGPPRREAHAVLFRCMVDFLASRGLTEAVKAAVPEQTRHDIGRPPWADRWLRASAVEDVVQALHGIGGPALNLELGRFLARRMTEGRLRPVVAGIFSVLGKSPAALFKSLNVCFSLAWRGILFRYETFGVEHHVVAHFSADAPPPGMHHALRGAFLHVFELSGARGAISEPRVLPEENGGVQVQYRLRF
jgi:hypothetical protein